MANTGALSPTTATAPRERQTIRARWRGWRRSRPFWAGLLTLLAGTILTIIPMAGLKVAFVQGSVLWASLLIGFLVLICGGSLWAGGRYAMLTGILTIAFSLVALITSNLGGFFLGTLLGLIGGSMALAWVPGIPQTETPVAGMPAGPSPRTG